MSPAVDLARDPWPTVEAAGAPRVPLVLVPLGSTEQHGPHLPFDVDARTAAVVSAGAAAALGDGVVVAPALAYGASGEHQGFPGTLSIGHEALAAVVVELARSATTWADRVLLVNGHGGNLDGLVGSVRRCRAEGRDVAWAPAVTAPGGDAHAGHVETSLLLHLDPGAVRRDALAPGATEPLGALLDRLRAGGTRAVAPDGVLGDPTTASSAEGAAILAASVEALVGRVRAWAPDDAGMLTVPAASTTEAAR